MNANLQIKMDLSDIIFYIVFAIIGIFSTVAQNKGKKKTEKATHPKPENNTQDESNMPSPYIEYTEQESLDNTMDEEDEVSPEHTLEEIFRALREGTPLVTKKTSQTTTTPVISEISQDKTTMTPTTSTPTFIEGERAINDISGNEISDHNIYDNESSLEHFNPETTDWRQAVITSEILSRKY